jgi:hypothetical protein
MRKIMLLIIGLVLVGASLQATIIQVPADQPTIQAGINTAVNGDTVLVADGIYVGSGNRDLDYGGKLITVKSASGAANTIIDCQADSLNQHGAFFFHTLEDSTAVIDGFTIRNAFNGYYAAVRCSSAVATIRNCVFTQNGYSAIHVYNGFGLTVENCVVTRSRWAGIQLGYCRAHITECSIDSNFGPGIAAYNNAAFDLTNSEIIGNAGYGTSVWVFTSKFHVSNCTFVGNQVGLFYDGDFPKSGTSGPATSAIDTITMRNNIFAFNREVGFKLGQFAGFFSANCNDWYGNPGGDFVSLSGIPFDTASNISVDPRFCHTPDHYYGIYNNSPCAPSGNLCQTLMGRYPVSCTASTICGDANGDGSIDVSDAVFLVKYIFAGGLPPNPLSLGDVNCDHSIDISDAVYLIIYIFSGGAAPCANCK